jgi:radical SAM superfamily enzyme YgiQ (UPF0313 family)
VKVTLIMASSIENKDLKEKPFWFLQPLTLAYLAGLTPPRVEVQAIDDRFEPIDYDEPRDLVGISFHTFAARRAYQIADEFRKRGTRVVLGGHHATLAPQEAIRHADAVLTGEAEGVWEQVIRDAERGQLQRFYRRDTSAPLSDLRINRSIFDDKGYAPIGMVEATRGCPHLCDFCSVSTFYNHSFRYRSPRDVAEEVERIGRKFVFFVDDNITADREAAKALFRELIPLKIRWVSQASLQTAQDPELMRLMQASGCLGVLAGIESIEPANLRQVNKSWNIANRSLAESLGIFREHGIGILGSFFLGMDGDTPESLNRMVEFARSQHLLAALFNLFTPYPGTKLHETFTREGRIRIQDWWLNPEYKYGKVVFHPKGMSAEELEETRVRLYREFYGIPSLAQRFFDTRVNCRDAWHIYLFAAMNLPAFRRFREGRDEM